VAEHRGEFEALLKEERESNEVKTRQLSDQYHTEIGLAIARLSGIEQAVDGKRANSLCAIEIRKKLVFGNKSNNLFKNSYKLAWKPRPPCVSIFLIRYSKKRCKDFSSMTAFLVDFLHSSARRIHSDYRKVWKKVRLFSSLEKSEKNLWSVDMETENK